MDANRFIDRDLCPLCGSTERDVHLEFQDIPVVRCTRCDMLYSSRILGDSALMDSYVDARSSERHRQGQQVNARCNTWVVDSMVGIESLDSLLDVGAGFGYLIKAVQDRKAMDAVGVELSRADARFGREELGLNMVDRTLADSGLPKGHYDLVASFEVIEHVADPLAFLAELTEYARPGGQLLICTDNFEGRAARALGAGLPKWIPYSHISHFSPATLQAAIDLTPGLNYVEHLTFTPWELWARMAREKVRGTGTQAADLTGTASATGGDSRETFRLYGLRSWLNPLWLKLTAGPGPHGDLMFFLAKKALS